MSGDFYACDTASIEVSTSNFLYFAALCHFGLTFAVEFFSGVYHPQDVRDEKVSLTPVHWEHGEIKTLVPL